MPDDSYFWLTSPGASALALLWLQGPGAEEFVAVRGGRVAELPRHAWLKARDNRPLDEVMIAREHGGLVVSCHGGGAVRRAFEDELAQAGFRPAGHPPDLFGMSGRYRRELVGLLRLCPGELAVRSVLYALNHGERLLREALARNRPRSLARVARAMDCARYLFEPPRVQLWGEVNSGKSSLLNLLCGRELAATGDEAGLTRDVIEGRFEHKGAVVRVFDAPGEFVAGQPRAGVDVAALELARSWREQADLVLQLVPAREIRAGRRPEPVAGAVLLVSRFDEDPDVETGEAGAVSSHDPPSVERLRAWLVARFLGPLLELDAGDRYALGHSLRLDMLAVAEGTATADDVLRRWLD